jgi:N-acetylmuramoyl-L-alanine amidase
LAGSGKPVNTGKRIFPIFGNELAYTPLISNALKGKIFYLVSGHGGPDPGAIGKRGGATLCEDEYAYDVTLRLCRKLIEHGATAYMIVRDPNDGIRYANNLKCDKDEVVWGDAEIKTSQIPRLKQRTDIINELYEKNRKLGFKDQYVIEIHVDSRSRSEQVDLFFYFQAESTPSKVLAERLHETMRTKYKQHRATGKYHGTVSIRGLYTLREVKPTAVYIELGNIRNAFDQQRIVLGSNRGILADWLLEGLIYNQNLSRQKRF